MGWLCVNMTGLPGAQTFVKQRSRCFGVIWTLKLVDSEWSRFPFIRSAEVLNGIKKLTSPEQERILEPTAFRLRLQYLLFLALPQTVFGLEHVHISISISISISIYIYIYFYTYIYIYILLHPFLGDLD